MADKAQDEWGQNIIIRPVWATSILKAPEELRNKLCYGLLYFISTGREPEDEWLRTSMLRPMFEQMYVDIQKCDLKKAKCAEAGRKGAQAKYNK